LPHARRLGTVALQELKCTIAEAQPTSWIQTFWSPGTTPSMSSSETIMLSFEGFVVAVTSAVEVAREHHHMLVGRRLD
jgi:hypothetical protein